MNWIYSYVEYKHVADELPLGSAQIKYDAGVINGVPKGGVLRCTAG